MSSFQMVSTDPSLVIDSFYAAAHMLIDAIITPSQTRSVYLLQHLCKITIGL